MMAIFMVATLSLGLASCSSDSDDGIKSPILGIWEKSSDANEKFIFNSNGSCIRQYINSALKGVAASLSKAPASFAPASPTAKELSRDPFGVQTSNFKLQTSNAFGVTDIVVDDNTLEQYYYGVFTVDGDKLTVTWIRQKSIVEKGGEELTTETEYSPQRVETGSFTINGDAIVIQLGDGTSFTTWTGKRSK